MHLKNHGMDGRTRECVRWIAQIQVDANTHIKRLSFNASVSGHVRFGRYNNNRQKAKHFVMLSVTKHKIFFVLNLI